ncbi:phosphotransferase family protein [Homoserinimonas sp. A520]
MTTTMMTSMTMTTDHAADAALLGAVAESLERTLVSHHRVSSTVIGDGVVVAHQVEFGSANGSESHLIYVETSPRTERRDGVLTMRDEATGDQVSVWVYPRDPALPALPAAVFPDGAAVILKRLGVDPGSHVALGLEAYRPGKRAVIRVDTDRSTVFLKVVAPGAAGVIAERHNAWLDAGLPVPQVLGWSDEGLVALSALRGTPAVEAVARLDPLRFTNELLALRQRIATIPSATDARTSLSQRLDWYERRLTQVHPALGGAIYQVATRIRTVLADAGAPPPVTIHGDLHVGQLFLDETDAITGVLDIDTGGYGDPADDAGALYAHLIVTAALNADRPEIAEGRESLAHHWRANWRREEDPDFAERATAIAATHLLAHALNQALDARELVERAGTLLPAHEY